MLARCKVPNKLVCKAGYRKSRSETFSRRAICRIIYYRVNSGRTSTSQIQFGAQAGLKETAQDLAMDGTKADLQLQERASARELDQA
jgi:hypothetical protein